MSKYKIVPTSEICGKIKISGSKNSSLPIIAATLLADGTSTLYNVPKLTDINYMCELSKLSGTKIQSLDDNTLEFNTNLSNIKEIPQEIVNKLRASFLILGPILARKGRIRIPYPGGCQIGARPIDLHLKGLSAMGAKIKQGHGIVDIKCKRLKGEKIYLDFPSVGATENIMLAATLADGDTIIENAATEPEIIDLEQFLCEMGAEISGAGTNTIKISGKRELNPARHTIIPDRIECGTYMTIAAACKSKITIENIIPEHLKPIIAKLNEMGVTITEYKNKIDIIPCEKLKTVDIKTMPHPGFPTDMQAQFMSLMSVADGTGVVIETIFENRFMQVPELNKMGAKIKIDGRTAIVNGRKKLSGAQVNATDLRAGAALVVAALSAQGESEINNIEYIERGYENFEKKLSAVGFKIEKLSADN